MNKCNKYKKINFKHNAKHSITVQNSIETGGDMGGFSRVWSNLATMYAIIEPMKQFEGFQYNSMSSNVSHKIIVRYQSIFADPLESVKYRIIFNSRQFEIVEAINLFEDNKYIRIIANEVNS